MSLCPALQVRCPPFLFFPNLAGLYCADELNIMVLCYRKGDNLMLCKHPVQAKMGQSMAMQHAVIQQAI